MRLGGLGCDRDIGPVTRGAQRDRQPDAAAAAGDEHRLALEGCHGNDSCDGRAKLWLPPDKREGATKQEAITHASACSTLPRVSGSAKAAMKNTQ